MTINWPLFSLKLYNLSLTLKIVKENISKEVSIYDCRYINVIIWRESIKERD